MTKPEFTHVHASDPVLFADPADPADPADAFALPSLARISLARISLPRACSR
ncbi:hypothetical protein [Streptomyces tauricus]